MIQPKISISYRNSNGLLEEGTFENILDSDMACITQFLPVINSDGKVSVTKHNINIFIGYVYNTNLAELMHYESDKKEMKKLSRLGYTNCTILVNKNGKRKVYPFLSGDITVSSKQEFAARIKKIYNAYKLLDVNISNISNEILNNENVTIDVNGNSNIPAIFLKQEEKQLKMEIRYTLKKTWEISKGTFDEIPKTAVSAYITQDIPVINENYELEYKHIEHCLYIGTLLTIDKALEIKDDTLIETIKDYKDLGVTSVVILPSESFYRAVPFNQNRDLVFKTKEEFDDAIAKIQIDAIFHSVDKNFSNAQQEDKPALLSLNN